jgi:hypothetical protein
MRMTQPSGFTPRPSNTQPTATPLHDGGHLTTQCAAASRQSSANGRTERGMDRACPVCLGLLLAWGVSGPDSAWLAEMLAAEAA